jgi:Xaa-Pro aminopeptidase
MNVPDIKDFKEKCRRVRNFLDENGFDAMILGRRDNFAWFTYGGDNKIFRSSDIGFGILVIKKDSITLVAQTMDAARIMDDELSGLPIECISLKWFEESREEKAIKIAGDKVVSDYPIKGADCRFEDIVSLHLPYTPWEVIRYEEVGALNDRLYAQVADQIKPGMTEQYVESIVMQVFGEHVMIPKVLLVGSDERIAKYRHPNASDKKIEKLLLFHTAADKYGMHAVISRMVYFGDKLPIDIEKKYELLNRCQASTFSMLKPGGRFAPMLEARKAILAEAGMLNEFDNHLPGAFTGYFIGGCGPVIANEKIVDTMCFDWFMTVTGAKVEELSMATPAGGRVLSVSGAWPVKEYSVGDYKCQLPQILLK